jgi:hypothetical protein
MLFVWVVRPYGLVGGNQRFGEKQSPSSGPKSPHDFIAQHQHLHRHENVKSHR